MEMSRLIRRNLLVMLVMSVFLPHCRTMPGLLTRMKTMHTMGTVHIVPAAAVTELDSAMDTTQAISEWGIGTARAVSGEQSGSEGDAT